MLSFYLRRKLLDYYLDGTVRVSLHADDPGVTGASEVSGGSYARQSPTFAPAAANGTKTASADIVFTGMPGGNVSHVGIWDAPIGGNFLQGGPLASSPSRVVVNQGDTFVLTKSDLIASLA